MTEDERRWWQPLWEFAVHGIVGMVIFILIAIPAVSLSLLLKWLQTQQIDVYLLYGLKGAEYLVFAVDLLLFGWFVVRTALRAGRKL